MGRPLPFPDRRIAEEAVRQGVVAAVVMEAAAREWTSLEGEESFPAYLVRREIVKAEQLGTLAKSLQGESEEEAAPAAGEAVPEKTPHPSEVVKGYRILERLGRGGMGSVYRAEQQGMNRVVALKILRRPFGESEEHVERLKREARLVGALDHANIVRGLDVGSHGPYHYFAMEFVEGDTLRELLRKRGVCPEAEALRIVEGICLALEHAHSRGVVHRDVKPGNVILALDGTPKLTDYGLAKGPTDFTLTQSGVTIGTPQYISPEQARDPVGVDIQTDLYSLGATAYHMLTGVPPHSSDTLAGLLTKVLYEKPRSARQVNPKVSPGASFLVEKMMAKQKRHRYRTPRDVLADLKALAAGKSIVPRDWAGDFEVHEVRRKYRIAVVAGTVVVAVVAAAAAVLQVREQRKNEALRENAAGDALRLLVEGESPKSKEEWETLLEGLEAFTRKDEFRDTRAARSATGEIERAQAHRDRWIESSAHGMHGDELTTAGKHNEAVAYLETAAEGLVKADRAKGRLPAESLRRQARAVREEGRRAAAELVRRAREDAERVPPREGALNEVLRQLQQARDAAYERHIVEPDRPAAIQSLDESLERLRDVKAEIEVARLGDEYRRRRDASMRAGEFRAVEDELDDVAKRMAGDARLQSTIEALPAPAAQDARTRTDRERDRLRTANRESLDGVLAKAKELEAVRDFDRAIELLDAAEGLCVRDLEPEVRAAREEIEKRKDQVRAEGERAVREYWEGFLRDLARRDFAGAGRRQSGAGPSTEPVPPGRAFAEAFAGAHFLLDRVEEAVFVPIRRRIQDGGPWPRGLRFLDPPRLLYPEVKNVRLRETETGPVVMFDAGTGALAGLTGGLYRIDADLLVEYAGLKGDGLNAFQAVARATLLLCEGESRERREIENHASLLRGIRDTLPAVAVPGVDALLARADTLVAAKIRSEENLEKLANEKHIAVQVALQARDPRAAIRDLDLLLGAGQPLNSTRYVDENRTILKVLRGQALLMADDQQLADYFRGFVVDTAPGRDALTKMFCDFEGDAAARAFVAPENDAPRLFRFVEGDGNGGGGGRLLFLDGDGTRATKDSPLVLNCPFSRDKFIAVSFRYRSERPLYLGVGIVGKNVGVLTDDGRKTSGRGVYAWQGDWKDPDRFFPLEYRHDYLPKIPDLLKYKDPKGQRYFQFEPGVTYSVRVEWDKGRLRLRVDGNSIWNVELDRGRYEDPQRIRIVTYGEGSIDDLAIEGSFDRSEFEDIRKRK